MKKNSINNPMIKDTPNKDTEQTIISLIFLSGFFIPQGNFFNIYVPIMIVFLAVKYFSLNKITNIQMVLILLISLSFFFYAVTSTSFDLDNKAYFRNIVIIELFLLFPFVGNIKIPNRFLYFALLFIFFSQISYMLGVGPIIDFFNTYYPYEGDRVAYQAEYLIKHSDKMSFTNRAFRLGGMYHNSNQCARYLNIILAVFLIENFNKSWRFKLPFIFIFALAIIATGSRTGFFITFAMIAYYLYLKSTRRKSISKHITVPVLIILVAFLIYNVSSGMSSELRFIDYNEGLEKSLFVKAVIFYDYISDNNLSIAQLLFGNFNNDGFEQIQFDSEWGELIFRYGFIFLITLFIFYWRVFKKTKPENRIIFFILFWIISSTVILNYRTSFIFMFLLSKYYNDRSSNNYKLNSQTTNSIK